MALVHVDKKGLGGAACSSMDEDKVITASEYGSIFTYVIGQAFTVVDVVRIRWKIEFVRVW
jgi:hypothetical protein